MPAGAPSEVPGYSSPRRLSQEEGHGAKAQGRGCAPGLKARAAWAVGVELGPRGSRTLLGMHSREPQRLRGWMLTAPSERPHAQWDGAGLWTLEPQGPHSAEEQMGPQQTEPPSAHAGSACPHPALWLPVP